MSHVQVGVVRYAFVATEIARALGESADFRVAVVARWECVVPAPSHEAG